MKRKFNFLQIFAAFGLLLLNGLSGFSQSKPFPQNVTYPNGFKTSRISTSSIQTNYNNWKSTYLKTCGSNQLRVEFNNPTGTTVSEGQGYGMIIAAYMGDRTTFDKLYSFEKARHNTYGNMGWRSNCNGFYNEGNNSGSVSATDGDLDIAYALCVAYNQWGGNFKTEAIDRINVIKTNNFTYNSGSSRWIQEWRDGTTETFGNSSYFMPGYYRVFKDFTGDNDWNTIAADTYEIMYAARNGTTGFVGNQVYASGSNKEDFVDYNGARTQFRMVMDYIWFGNTDGKNIVDKTTNWVNGKGGLSNVKDGYYIDGRERSSWNQSPAWVGSFACGAMAKSQADVNTYADYFNTCTYDEYYASSLRILYQLFLTGNYWKPTSGSGGSGGGNGGGGGGGGGTTGITNNGIYRLKCNWGNKYLNVEGNAAGAVVGVANLNTGWGSQKWKLENVSGSVYRLRNEWSGKYMNGSNTVGQKVYCQDLNTSWDSEKWTFENVSGSVYRLKCNYGNKYLNGNNTDGADVGMQDLNTGWDSEKWTLEAVSSSARTSAATAAVVKAPAATTDASPRLRSNMVTGNDLTIISGAGVYNVTILNGNGANVLSRAGVTGNTTLNVTSLTGGTYTIIMDDGKNRKVQRLIIAK
jgi:endo-1,4-beta-D-glucanase Y